MEYFFLTAQTILYALGFFAVALTILPLFKFYAWWIRIGEFPRLQIAAACLAVLIFLPVFIRPLTLPEIVFLVAVSPRVSFIKFTASCVICRFIRNRSSAAACRIRKTSLDF
jgi:hypothetical protein